MNPNVKLVCSTPNPHVTPATRLGDMTAEANMNFDKIITDHVLAYITLVLNFWVLFILALFGVAANILVLIIYFRQGFKDGVNMSLTSIVLWDLLKCLCIVTNRLKTPIEQISPPDAESWFNVTVIYSEFLFIIACHVTYVLASYVSVERCLYVCMPFKVRSLFTPSLTLVVVSLISVLVSGAHVVILLLFKVIYVISLIHNVTVADTTFTNFYHAHGQEVLTFYNAVGTALPLSSFIILCLASGITMYQLRKASTKIKRHTGVLFNYPTKKHPHSSAMETPLSKVQVSIPASGMSQREKQVSKMLLVVLLVYIINLFPRQLYYMASLIQPEYGLFRKYHNVFVASSNILFVFDVTNASINFFIFFKMSSNFRQTFSQIIHRQGSQV